MFGRSCARTHRHQYDRKDKAKDKRQQPLTGNICIPATVGSFIHKCSCVWVHHIISKDSWLYPASNWFHDSPFIVSYEPVKVKHDPLVWIICGHLI